MKLNNYVIIAFAWVTLFCMSCNPVVLEEQKNTTPPVHYDTLTLTEGDWIATIKHMDSPRDYLVAHLVIYREKIVEEDSIPYTPYNVVIMAETQDTLLPLGTYTSEPNVSKRVLVKEGHAWGAGSARWFKEEKFYDYKDLSVVIGIDTTRNYYLDAFIQMEEGENLYIHCPTIWRHYVLVQEGVHLAYDETYYPTID